LVAASAGSTAGAVAPVQGGILMNYSINSHKGTAAMDAVRDLVEAHNGIVLSQYKQVGVTVAQSNNPTFAQELRATKGIIDSVGPTRTSAVNARFEQRDLDAGLVIEPEPREDEQYGNTILDSLAANEIQDGSPSVVVGVLDTGVNDLHEDLSASFNRDASVDCESGNGVPNTANGAWRPTTFTHGTHVAGTIVAARNGLGVAGIAPGVQYASIKVVDDSGFIFPEYAMCGFMWAVAHGVEVTNNSYFIDPWYFYCPSDADQAAVMESVRRVIDYSQKQGVINVAAAGNESYDLAHKTTDSISPDDSTPIPNRPVDATCLDLPTEHPGVLTVSAVEIHRNLTSFSNYGRGIIDVAAPGESILSTTWPGTHSYGYLSGTSMASPHVAGVVALIESQTPGLSLKAMTKRVYQTSVPRSCGGNPLCEGPVGNNGFYGHGIVNALNAVS
jgi:subtilisin family serine protease